MKKFLKKKWHSIPVALVSALLVLALVAGGAFAAYTVWTASATATVDEAIIVTHTVLGTGEYDWSDWTDEGAILTVYGLNPGQYLVPPLIDITNEGPVDLSVTITITQTGGAGTDWRDGDQNNWDNRNGPAPEYSWYSVGGQRIPDVGNPLTIIMPAGGSLNNIPINFRAGTSVIPGEYAFTITVER